MFAVMRCACRLTNTNPHVCLCVCVCCFEDSFVNSQEWTLSRLVPDLKLVSVIHVLCMCECGGVCDPLDMLVHSGQKTTR